MPVIPPVVWMVTLAVGMPILFAVCLMMANKRPEPRTEHKSRPLKIVQGNQPK